MPVGWVGWWGGWGWGIYLHLVETYGRIFMKVSWLVAHVEKSNWKNGFGPDNHQESRLSFISERPRLDGFTFLALGVTRLCSLLSSILYSCCCYCRRYFYVGVVLVETSEVTINPITQWFIGMILRSYVTKDFNAQQRVVTVAWHRHETVCYALEFITINYLTLIRILCLIFGKP